MNRSLHMMTWTLLVFATVLGTGCPRQPVREKARQEISPEHSTPKDRTAPAAKVEPANNDQPSEFSELIESDLERSSWENPFHPRLWSSDGWWIDEDSMASESDSGQPATFLRPYRNVVIECRFSKATEDRTKTVQERSPIECELRLLSRDSNRWTSLLLGPGDIVLAESVDGANTTVRTLRKTERATGDDPLEAGIRLTLTPNRLLVAVDGQMRINVARPGSIMMSDCLAQFVVSEASIELSDLRFEGD